MRLTPIAFITAFCACTGALHSQALQIDFGQPASPVEAGWVAYIASHEVPAQFTTQTFSAFGGTNNIALTPTWADDPGGAAAAKQMILRTEATPSPALYQDWIGTDTRGLAASDPMTLTISGLPAGGYELRSHHHDPQNQTGLIDITVNDANGATVTNGFDQSAGGGAGATPAVFETPIESNGADDITITYHVVDVNGSVGGANFFIMNGIEFHPTADPDSDGDGLLDLWEDIHFGDLSQDGTGDPDSDGANNEQEETAGTNPTVADTDGDGLSDGDELNVHNTDPLDTDTDGDGIADDEELVAGADGFVTEPANRDTDGDNASDGAEVANGTDPTDGSDFPRVAELAVDFNSNQDGGGSSATEADPSRSAALHNQVGYQSYHANHEVAAEFALASYNAFGAVITLLPEWPDTTANTVMQSIDRGAGNDANWGGQSLDLLTDWIGTDTRTGSGGNGAYDGVTGTPTRMTMRIGGLPAGSYTWRSFHHDTEHMNPAFIMEVSTDGGLNFTQIGGVRRVTDSTPAGTPPSPLGEFDGVANPASGDPADLPSTVNTCFISNGTDEVVFQYTPYSTAEVHQSFFVMNGFEIDEMPNDSDDDCFDDTAETDAFGDLSQGPNDDFDSDGLDNITETIRGTNPTVVDTDGDGVSDGEEVNTHGSDPLASDTDGDGLSDGEEVNTHGSDPVLADTDGDGYNDGFEVANAASGFDVLVDDSLEDPDGDGSTNAEELLDGTDPLDPDSDDDGLNDGDEFTNTTDPLDPDSDDDGLNDGDEILAGTNPNNPDSDGDGMNDGYEVANSLDPLTDDAGGDPDGDGLTNGEEALAGSDPNVRDTDGDGIEDGVEWNVTFTDPTRADTDLDGLRDGDEDLNADGIIDPGETDPNNADTDGDGYNDKLERDSGTNPDDSVSFPAPPAGALFVDFDNGGNQDGGFHDQAGYQSYTANHEVAAEFVTVPFNAFGTTVDFTPTWPATTDNRVQQMIDRGAGDDALWAGDKVDLLTDWIGVDTRTASGGLGDYDGVNGTPTPMLFTLSGLPADDYRWRSYHHDTQFMWTAMQMEVSTDGGATFGAPILTEVTNSNVGGTQNPVASQAFDGPLNPGSFDPADLPSTITTTFTANGADDVVIRFIALSEVAVHRQFVVVNGFELTVAGPSADLVVTGFDSGAGNLEVEITDVSGTVYLGYSTDGQNFFEVGGATFAADFSGPVGPFNPATDQTVLLQLFDAPLPPAP